MELNGLRVDNLNFIRKEISLTIPASITHHWPYYLDLLEEIAQQYLVDLKFSICNFAVSLYENCPDI